MTTEIQTILDPHTALGLVLGWLTETFPATASTPVEPFMVPLVSSGIVFYGMRLVILGHHGTTSRFVPTRAVLLAFLSAICLIAADAYLADHGLARISNVALLTVPAMAIGYVAAHAVLSLTVGLLGSLQSPEERLVSWICGAWRARFGKAEETQVQDEVPTEPTLLTPIENAALASSVWERMNQIYYLGKLSTLETSLRYHGIRLVKRSDKPSPYPIDDGMARILAQDMWNQDSRYLRPSMPEGERRDLWDQAWNDGAPQACLDEFLRCLADLGVFPEFYPVHTPNGEKAR
ncbi:MAG: hypothetical protein K9H25_17235 [Rhodospirillum sp.]|nr:hypothetical protein [Rhodospirillum sp.]MCF8503219.1 hypothetical protein [Rhodospirillum sp.]